MEWSWGILRATYESFLLSLGVWDVLLPYVIWGQRIAFFCLLLVATVGRRLSLRRKYVEVLDRVFQFAAVELAEEVQLEEEEEEGEEEEDGVVICPEAPRAGGVDSPSGSFRFQDPMAYMAAGMRAVVQDCVSQSFSPAELRTWNMMSRFHDTENRPTHGIAVANHTSPIDSMVLATDQCYDMVGQKASGILGVFMHALSRSSSHIWFERTAAKERSQAVQKLQEHAQDPTLPPILIFPEGTCVNNTAVLQFKKGSFEIDTIIYPIAIRFDPRYGDAFWYQDTFVEYIFSMMTSWAIVCDVWYLPPMTRGTNESPVAFANRVKAKIAHRGGFVQLAWDGFIKLNANKKAFWEKQSQWKQKQQQEFARHFNAEEHCQAKD
ncbi:glycerol-3-phosphate acyltransferase 3-like isoform X2 [Homarus americanus]|uniref:glycerol-3-phosphate acyltransferase 3-like isoform X2 n=1 Tax=Homarus americanus TaxID=6706 RepID=UPI001C4625DC|nr:glycerol-3-phosphate acyltransferase 3-like isoform X2 [Homarus americanus]